jgi:hypothetical protein
VLLPPLLVPLLVKVKVQLGWVIEPPHWPAWLVASACVAGIAALPVLLVLPVVPVAAAAAVESVPAQTSVLPVLHPAAYAQHPMLAAHPCRHCHHQKSVGAAAVGPAWLHAALEHLLLLLPAGQIAMLQHLQRLLCLCAGGAVRQAQ